MDAETRTRRIYANVYEIRLTDGGSLPRLEVRVRGSGEEWRPEVRAWVCYLAAHAAEMESRANEYHDTTMQQAKRIAELEAESESMRSQILDYESALASAHGEIARLTEIAGELFA